MNTRVWKFQNKILRNLKVNKEGEKGAGENCLMRNLMILFVKHFFFSLLGSPSGSRPPHC